MSTLYELFKVDENATQEEIKQAYENILNKANSYTQNVKINQQISRIKIAYGILSNPEKLKKYDLDLATKIADKLLESIQKSEKKTEDETPKIDEERIRQAIKKEVNKAIEQQELNEIKENMAVKAEEEKIKRQKKEERRRMIELKKAKELKKEQEIMEYGRYLENQGYKVKYPWTWRRVKSAIISLISIIIGLVILWHIPFIRNAIINLYNENVVIKYIVDSIKSIINV